MEFNQLSNNDVKNKVLAYVHALIIPFFIVIVTYLIDTNFTIVAPLSYLTFLSLLHLFRVLTSSNEEYVQRGKEFLDTVFLTIGILIIFLVAFLALVIL